MAPRPAGHNDDRLEQEVLTTATLTTNDDKATGKNQSGGEAKSKAQIKKAKAKAKKAKAQAKVENNPDDTSKKEDDKDAKEAPETRDAITPTTSAAPPFASSSGSSPPLPPQSHSSRRSETAVDSDKAEDGEEQEEGFGTKPTPDEDVHSEEETRSDVDVEIARGSGLESESDGEGEGEVNVTKESGMGHSLSKRTTATRKTMPYSQSQPEHEHDGQDAKSNVIVSSSSPSCTPPPTLSTSQSQRQLQSERQPPTPSSSTTITLSAPKVLQHLTSTEVEESQTMGPSTLTDLNRHPHPQPHSNMQGTIGVDLVESDYTSESESESESNSETNSESEDEEGEHGLASAPAAFSINPGGEVEDGLGVDHAGVGNGARNKGERDRDRLKVDEIPQEDLDAGRDHRLASDSEQEDDSDDDDDGEGEEGDEDDDDDDEEEEEPALKYQRLTGAVSEILVKDSASAFATSRNFLALGTHNGMVHILTYDGGKIKSFRPHSATISTLTIDDEGEFVATASVDGRVVVHGITSSEIYAFDLKRPMKSIAMEPGFAKKSTRSFVCGGMAGTLVLHEKGWLGHKERVLHSGEGPIYTISWKGPLIVWANDMGVKIYDTVTDTRIGFIDRPANAPRAEAFKCTLYWSDESTLIIAWADHIKIVKIRQRTSRSGPTGLAVGMSPPPSYSIEISAIFQVDCMLSGVASYKKDNKSSLLVLSYIAPDDYSNEATDDPMEQRRKAANRPELRIISKAGEELSSDALSLGTYHLYGCNDYLLVPSARKEDDAYFLVSPKDIVIARPRDAADHVNWLVEQQRFAEALEAAELLVDRHGQGLDIKAIGTKYIKHLFDAQDFSAAAALCPKVFGSDVKSWEDWIFQFVQHHQLSAIIPYIPIGKPKLGRLIYDMMIAHFLANDKEMLLKIIREWPKDIYDTNAVIVALQGEMESSGPSRILMECLAELHIAQYHPAKALPYLLRIRRPDVFLFIRDHNLFSAVQDQVQLLVDFDQEIESKEDDPGKHGRAIALLVDHTYAIPIERVVAQLESKPRYLYMYLDALFKKDSHLASDYADRQVALYADYDPSSLLDFLRASNYYSLEKAYQVCKGHDFVPEMVFLLGRMGNNRQALMLIIERLGDVKRAIDFAKDQADEDLWEDLLTYSENKPTFIRGLLENVGSDIDPLRVIRRISDGLEIPGLKSAIITILQASNLQVSLLEGCRKILYSDASNLAQYLHTGQTAGEYGTHISTCQVCSRYLYHLDQETDDCPVVIIYLCRHAVHATCVLNDPSLELPARPEMVTNFLISDQTAHGKSLMSVKNLGAKLAYAASLRIRVKSCPVCSEAATATHIHA